MQKFRLYFLFLLSALSLKLSAQEKTYTIPFQLTDYNNLAIKAVLNKKDTVNLMFHTAASDITLTEEALKKIKSLKFNRTDSVKSWGGADNTSRYSESNTVQIGELQWEHIPIWENKNSGQYTDGKFGLELFANQTIEIDFDKKLIIVSAQLPAKVKSYQKLKLSFEQDMMFVEGTSTIGQNNLNNKFLIHSGYSGAVLFDDKFVADHKIGEQLIITAEKQLKDSFGNVLKTKKAILPSFTIGNQKLSNVSVGFFEGALGRQKMSIIGGDLIKRFNIVIDAKRQFIYLKANKLKNLPYANV